MAEPTIQLGNGNWAGKSDNLLGYYKEGERFYKQDFTFSRSTSGTRVNSSGLIETAEILGNELVTNGDFNTDSDWTKGSGWTISGGKATKSGTDLAYLTQSSLTSVVGKTYRVKASITNVTTGNIRIDNFTSGTTYTSNVEIDITYTATSAGVFRFLGWGGFDGSIDNVSVKEVFQVNIPRVDYLNNSNGSLILEPQRTNILTYSNFQNHWSLDDTNIVANNTTSPDGTVNGNLLKGNTNSSRHNVYKSFSPQSTDSVLSVFAKAKELRYIQIASANTTSQYANFDVSSGVVGNVGSDFSNAKIEDYGNGWYRCSVTATNQSNAFYFGLISGLTSSWLESWTMSNDTDGLYIWGAMAETNASYPTSYIPTSGSSVTRNQDTCSITNVEDRINSSEGVLFVETSYVNKGYGNSIAITDGTNTQRVQIYFNNANLSLLLVVKVNDTIVGTHTVSSSGINWDSINKIAIKYKTNDMSFWLNGTKVAEDTSGTMFSANTLTKLGFDSGSGGSFYGKCNQIQVYNTALSDSELATLTTL